jgi:uncharacterized protein YdeI (YjbR/CyaY-like superfamily)
MKNTSPDVDRYIANAAPFAQPILEKIRKAFHKADPEIEEVMKWSFPHFEHNGIVGSMAAFKQHVTWGFWKAKLMSDTQAERTKVTSVKDLPSEKDMADAIREAVRLNEEGVKVERAPRVERGEVEVPPELAAALKKTPAAKKAFEGFSPSHRREYIEWITEAKTDATRQKRIAQTVEWLSEGKVRNWKYVRK